LVVAASREIATTCAKVKQPDKHEVATKFTKWSNFWWMEPDVVKDLRKRAKTYKEISRQLPISVMTAWRKVNQKEKGKFEKTSELRLYDGRWDLITAFTPSSHNRRGVAFASAIYSSAMDAAGTRGHRLPWMRY